ncbi:DUF4238 domain-containing protein [Nocardia sp. NPDC005745]|uniref:DUF4238 domain-containing protein n=1 Tax=Nocardia sp. NPDC005745 TaxID=3157061 RepID=UPI0033C2676C
MTPRHHLVPEGYLRHFAKVVQGKKFPVVALVDRNDPSRTILQSVNGACAEVGFYRIEADDLARVEDRRGHDPEVVENQLSHFESEGLKVIDKFTKELSLSSMTQEDWYNMINFIALQAVRGHRWREDLNALATHHMRQFLWDPVSDNQIRQWLIDEGRPFSQADILAYRHEITGERGPRLIAHQAVLVQESIRMAFTQINERLADRMAWNLIVGQEGSVLTSDEPVCWWKPGNGPVGFGSARVAWIPLSDRTILQIHDYDTAPDKLGLPTLKTPAGREALIRFVNREVAGQATRWIVHHPDSQVLDGIDLPPRTEWRNQLVERHTDERTVREHHLFRRLPRNR